MLQQESVARERLTVGTGQATPEEGWPSRNRAAERGRLNRRRLAYTFRRAPNDTPRSCRADRVPPRVTIRIVLFWIAAACCVVAELAILRSLLFGRAARPDRLEGRPVTAPTPKRATEVAWAILPAVGLLLVLYLTWRAVDAPLTPSADADRGGVVTGV